MGSLRAGCCLLRLKETTSLPFWSQTFKQICQATGWSPDSMEHKWPHSTRNTYKFCRIAWKSHKWTAPAINRQKSVIPEEWGKFEFQSCRNNKISWSLSCLEFVEIPGCVDSCFSWIKSNLGSHHSNICPFSSTSSGIPMVWDTIIYTYTSPSSSVHFSSFFFYSTPQTG